MSHFSFAPAAILSRLGKEKEKDLFQLLDDYPQVDKSSMLKQLSLHLPRFDIHENHQAELVLKEAQRIVERVSTLRRSYLSIIPKFKLGIKTLERLYFCKLSDKIASPILECFHYIFSFRHGSLHFGLKNSMNDEWPVALASLSPFDLSNIRPALTDIGISPSSIMVLSRVFAFPGAPINTISFLLAHIRRWLVRYFPEIEILVTYLNPNIGFSGSSYKADNWIHLGKEHNTRYFYIDKNYKTDRFIYERFGAPPEVLINNSLSSYNITLSKCYLEPLEILIRKVKNIKLPSSISPYIFPRWTPD